MSDIYFLFPAVVNIYFLFTAVSNIYFLFTAVSNIYFLFTAMVKPCCLVKVQLWLPISRRARESHGEEKSVWPVRKLTALSNRATSWVEAGMWINIPLSLSLSQNIYIYNEMDFITNKHMLLSPHIVKIPEIFKTVWIKHKKTQLTWQTKDMPNHVWLFSVQILKISLP